MMSDGSIVPPWDWASRGIRLTHHVRPWLRQRSCPLNAGANKVDGLSGLHPAKDLYPFALFEILIMLEEMADLLDKDFRQVAIARNPLVEWMKLIDGHCDDFLVDT